MKAFLRLAIGLSVLLSCWPFDGQAAPRVNALGNDLDGDGYSEMVLIDIERDNSLTWKIFSGRTGVLMEEQSKLGVAGNNICLANWLSPAAGELAWQAAPSQQVTWNVKGKDGKILQKTLGRVNDTLISGGDFNGNGIADAVIVRDRKNGTLLWRVHHDFFGHGVSIVRNYRKLGSTRRVISTVFGKSGDRPFFVDPKGQGDWIALIRGSGTKFHLTMKNIYTKRVRRIPLGEIPSGAMRPLPLKQASGADVVAFPKRDGGVTQVDFVSLKGALLAHALFPGNGEVLVGNFSDDPGMELLVQDGRNYSIFNPNSGVSTTVRWDSGIPIDYLNINAFDGSSPPNNPATPTPAATPSGPDDIPPEDNPPPPAGNLAAVCTAMHPIDTSVLYKPGSGGTSDARTGKPAFLWYDFGNNPHVMKLYVLASNGQQIAIFGFYNVGYPLVRFYSGFSPGTGDTGGSLASKASSLTGSTAVYFYTKNGNCWGPVRDPRQRTGGK